MVRVACDPRSPSLCFESPPRTPWGTQFVCHTAGIPLHHRISSRSSVRGEAGMGLITSYTGAWCLWNTYTTTANRFLFIYFLICLESMKSPLKRKDIFSLPVSFSASSWHFALSCRRKPHKIMWDMVESTCIFKNKADKILESCSANWRNCLATFFLICLEHRDFVNSATPGQCWLSPGDTVTYI